MKYKVRRAAVIGSGTMGGGIAAHLANIGIQVDLLDIVPRQLTPDEEAKGLTLESPAVRNRIVNNGWMAQVKARPAALFSPAKAELVRTGNLDDNFEWLSEADWICEVIVENLAIKQGLMEKLDAIRQPHTIIATNTSGLPIKDIAAGRSEGFKQHFLGMHFFNPPRYLKLLEMIPHEKTLPEVLEAMTRFGEDELGKGVVIAKDTPNFIGNRLFSIVNSFELSYAIDNGYSIEEVDNLCGPLIGRPKTGVFRLLDLVGLDVMGHVGANLYDLLPHDESRELLRNPKVAKITQTLIENGWLGNKTRQGFYKQVTTDKGKEFWTLNLETLEYSPPESVRFDSVGMYRKMEPTSARLKAMVEADDRAGAFIRNSAYNRLTYASRRIPEIADTLVAVDNAVKWGFNQELGPFEEWDALGVAETTAKMEDAGFEPAAWVKAMVDAGYKTFYQYENGVTVGYYDLASGGYVAFEENPKVIKVADLRAQGRVVEGNDDASVLDMGDGIALFQIHTKANTLTPAVIEMGYRAIEMLDNDDFNGMVIGNDGDNFCGGANLDIAGLQTEATQRGITPAEVVDELVHSFQQFMLGLRYCSKPVVSAPFQMALGGGAELTMAPDRIVAHAETYIGQTEAGIMGLVPAACGSKELLRRIMNPAMRIPNADPLPPMTKIFELIGMAKVATSATEGQEFGFLGPCDRIVANRDHLLYRAKQEALHLWERGYRAPTPEKIYAAGRDVLAAIQTQLFMFKDAGYATEHDVTIGEKIAWILCGGDLSEPAWVDEQYILDLEREAFVALMQHPKTVERIFHFLSTRKPLRN